MTVLLTFSIFFIFGFMFRKFTHNLQPDATGIEMEQERNGGGIGERHDCIIFFVLLTRINDCLKFCGTQTFREGLSVIYSLGL